MNSPPVLVRFPPALLADVDASIAGQSPRPSRPEEIRRLVKERLAMPSEARLRQVLIWCNRTIDELTAHVGELERQRDAYAARAARLEVVPRPGEQSGARQSPHTVPAVERWPAGPRSDPETVARAKAELATAEAEQRRREEGVLPRG
jgi:hypothetical protein